MKSREEINVAVSEIRWMVSKGELADALVELTNFVEDALTEREGERKIPTAGLDTPPQGKPPRAQPDDAGRTNTLPESTSPSSPSSLVERCAEVAFAVGWNEKAENYATITEAGKRYWLRVVEAVLAEAAKEGSPGIELLRKLRVDANNRAESAEAELARLRDAVEKQAAEWSRNKPFVSPDSWERFRRDLLKYCAYLLRKILEAR